MRPLAAIAALTLALAGCVRTNPIPTLAGPPTAAQPIDFTLPLWPSRTPHQLASDRGHVVLLDVWATWCEPCRDALPTYEQLQKEYGSRGFRVYAINVDADSALVQAFVQETKLTLPVLLDPDVAVAEKVLNVKLMPTSFLLDRNGRIRYVHEGFAEDFLAKYQSEIELLLAEKAEAP